MMCIKIPHISVQYSTRHFLIDDDEPTDNGEVVVCVFLVCDIVAENHSRAKVVEM